MMALRHLARSPSAAAAAARRLLPLTAEAPMSASTAAGTDLLLHASSCLVPSTASAAAGPRRIANARHLASASGGGGGGGGDDDDEDPFGLRHVDSPDPRRTGNVGTDLPPSYVRDPTTGKMTGEVEAELTPKEKRLLNLSEAEAERELVERFATSWNGAGTDGAGGSEMQGKVAARIREERAAMNVLGRKPAAVVGFPDGGTGAVDSGGGYTQPLSDSEMKSFREYMRRETGSADALRDDGGGDDGPPIPTQRKATATPRGARDKALGDSSDPDLDLTWMSSSVRTEMGDDEADDPFVDLLPSDLNPARKVNRRRAKRLPPQLLHHNNLALLRRYVTPGGQIMDRVQSRLGARDQRKIAKLIKRARHLGLIPYVGQWKYEDHGNIHEKDIDSDRNWEKELKKRGLVTRDSQKTTK